MIITISALFESKYTENSSIFLKNCAPVRIHCAIWSPIGKTLYITLLLLSSLSKKSHQMWPIEEAIFWSHLPRNLLTTKNTIWAKMRICLSTWVSTLRSRFKRMYFARNLDWWNFIFQMYRYLKNIMFIFTWN